MGNDYRQHVQGSTNCQIGKCWYLLARWATDTIFAATDGKTTSKTEMTTEKACERLPRQTVLCRMRENRMSPKCVRFSLQELHERSSLSPNLFATIMDVLACEKIIAIPVVPAMCRCSTRLNSRATPISSVCK